MTVAGLAAAAAVDVSAQQAVAEKTVEIKTPDGTCDAAFIHPATGRTRQSFIWPDAFGLRPSMRNMAKRLCRESGYSVLVPNPYYRVGKAPMWEDASKVDFTAERPKLNPMMQSINAAGTVEKDAPAFIAWLDQQPQVDRTKKVGTQGYCMGGALVVRTAAAVPDRVGAGASFHGGGSSHERRTARTCSRPRSRARMYFGIADQRRHAAARREDDAEDRVRRGQGPSRSRGLRDGAARLVRARHAEQPVQDGRRRARVGQVARACTRRRCLGVTTKSEDPKDRSVEADFEVGFQEVIEMKSIAAGFVVLMSAAILAQAPTGPPPGEWRRRAPAGRAGA
jgi:carboxymethylenebutenolidase